MRKFPTKISSWTKGDPHKLNDGTVEGRAAAPRREGESLLAVGSNYPWCPLASWVTVVPMIHIHCFAESYYRYSYYDASLLLPLQPTRARLKHEYILIFLLYNCLTALCLPLDLTGLWRREKERNSSIPSNKSLLPSMELLFPPLFQGVHLPRV